MKYVIGDIIHPSWNYDLESSLRAQRLLVTRALRSEWRFPNQWVITGPFETMLGKSSCGSRFGDTSRLSLGLLARDGLKDAVRTVNDGILRAVCEYPSFAQMDEVIHSQKFRHCGDAFDALLPYESGRTRERMNKHHKAATLVRNVRLDCTDRGIYLNADVTFNRKPCESRWGLWWLARRSAPKWNERLRLDTWLNSAIKELDALVKPLLRKEQ